MPERNGRNKVRRFFVRLLLLATAAGAERRRR